MSAFLYYLLLKPLSLLPLRVLYVFADILYIGLFRVIGFRRKVVLGNLRNAFPEKSEAEIKQLSFRFYRHLADLIVEGVYMFSMSPAEGIERMRLGNPEVLSPFYEQGKSIFLVIGHYNSWEYAAFAMNPQMAHQAAALYAPLSNPFFNEKIKEARGRCGITLIPKQDAARYMASARSQPIALLMGADQSPTFSKSVHWTTFLRQETAVMLGTELFSRRYDMPVFFAEIRKVQRGRYDMWFTLLEGDPRHTVAGEITEMHTRALEQQILAEPAYWLWSHRRWKRKRK